MQYRLLMTVRDALRSDFPQAVALLGLTNLRLAKRLEQMTVGEIEALGETLGPRLIVRMDESLAIEMMVNQLSENAEDQGMSRMAALATEQSRSAVTDGLLAEDAAA